MYNAGKFLRGSLFFSCRAAIFKSQETEPGICVQKRVLRYVKFAANCMFRNGCYNEV